MSYLNKIVILLLLRCGCYGLKDFKIPDVNFEALKLGGFRAHILAFTGITSFRITAYVNGQTFNATTYTSVPYSFVIYFYGRLKVGDSILYFVTVDHNGLNYSGSDKIWKVTELLDSFTDLNDFMPDVQFEALKTGGFRAYIQALTNLNEFSIDGNINGKTFNGKASTTNGYYLIINFNKNLIIGDLISYKMLINQKILPNSAKAGLTWKVTELLDSYSPLEEDDSSQNFIPLPKVEFEALESGGFRAYTPAVPGITNFEIDGRVNSEPFRGSTNAANNSYFIINFNKNLKLGDFILYRKKFIKGLAKPHVIEEEGVWIITAAYLLDSYSTLAPKCKKSKTHSSTTDVECFGELIMADDFDGPVIDNSKWIIEHRIPTYFSNNDKYEFNSYENTNETCFIRDGILYLKPVVRSQSEIGGVLDLSVGCTSNDNNQCYHERKSVFIVPPVKSGRITSKNSFQYGKIEIKAKLPVGDWLAPVIHLQLGAAHLNDSISPRVLIGFSRGNVHLVCATMEDLGGHWLYGGVTRQLTFGDDYPLLKKRFNNIPYHKYFHVYTLEWIPGKMSFYVDSDLYGNITGDDYSEFMKNVQGSDPSEKEFVISLGVAVGGLLDFPDSCNSGDIPKPWNNSARSYVKSFFEDRDAWLPTWNRDDTALQIDYVKVWAI